ncbi:serine-protein kinase ATM isoform X2 [Anthonomus grandis grandis]|nr:serine-protein kinase ATM isoform X2 [Anthonomus grandis grandis]XP_050307939.1 serine-protein kinase ATM isoform X2 [Anthonomus grandis grandis]
MSLQRELIEHQANLKSNKVTERRPAVEKLTDLLNNGNIIPYLNKEDPLSWKDLLEDSQYSLKIECDKFADTVNKKGASKGPDKFLSNSIELVVLIVKAALKEGDEKINIPLIIKYVDGCLRERNMKVCRDPFLRLIKEYILPNHGCLGSFDPEDFIMLFSLLKSEVLKCNNSDSNNVIIFTCFNLLIKNGSLGAFPPSFLREQFPFLTQLCQSISSLHPRAQQEVAVEILLNFCKYTAEDNRLSCCKLGETVFSTLLDLYCASGHDSILKVNVIEFFLLQMVIHNPNGESEGSPEAVASNWHDWRSCIKRMYNILLGEVSQYLKQCVKNTLFFVPHEQTTVILDSFVCLFVEVCKQLFSDSEYQSSISVSSDSSLEMHTQIHKKRKVATSLEAFITEIEETKSWVWVKLVGSVLKTYPQLVVKKTFLNLLQILHTLQLEVKDSDTVSHIYETQAVLIDIESTLEKGYEVEIETLWKLVGDSTLRAVGLNQHIKQTQSLLQKLMHRNIVNVESVIQTFFSGVLIITEHHFKTLHLVLENLNLSQLELSKKEELFHSLLNSQNVKDYRCFLKNDFASILVALTLKQCPDLSEPRFDKREIAYKHLIDLYSKTQFKIRDIDNTKDVKAKKSSLLNRNFNTDTETLQLFTQKLESFVEASVNEPIERILCIVGLLHNILSSMLDFQVIHESQIKENIVFHLIMQLFGLGQVTSLAKYKSHSDGVLKEILSLANVLDDLFSLKNNATCVVKEAFPIEFLKGLMDILNFFQDVVGKKTELEHSVKVSLTKALSKFCLVSKTATKRQLQIMAVFANPDYDFSLDTDYDLAMSFLQNIHLASPGLISEEIVDNILECIRELCAAKYKNYKCSMDVLKILKDVYKHFQYLSQNECKTVAVQLLQQFFLRSEYYGLDISILILDCIEELCKVDPAYQYSLWDGREIIKFVPKFLKSDFQRVRYRAIEILVEFFKSACGTTSLETIHRAEELLELTYKANVDLFEVEGELTEERRIDEVIFRACSALYTFLSVIIGCNSWIEESLFCIIKLEHSKGLFNVLNGELMQKVFRCLKNYFNSEDFMEPYVETLLNKWINLGYNLNDFQFRMLGCSDKKTLYVKHFDTCLPLLLKIDRNDLFAAAKSLNLTEKQVFERCCTKIFGRALATDTRNVGDKFIEKNVVVTYLSQVLGSRFKENLIENIDQVVLSLLGAVTDEKAIEQTLGETILFTTKQLSFQDFKKCLNYIEGFLCSSMSLTDFLINGTAKNKIQLIALELQLKIYNTVAEQRLNAFYHYAIFIDLILSSLKRNLSWSVYFLRDTIYSLIHLIQNTNLSKPVLRYLFSFLKKILPERCKEFQSFLVFTVNSLKKTFSEQDSLKGICIEILEYLIVANGERLLIGIKKLDSFPSSPEFDKIRATHHKIKYDQGQLSLEDEIRTFLEYNEMAARQDSLDHLKTILSKEKPQLDKLYVKLKLMRGFSEDCEKSLLHRLTSLLIKMSCYPNENVSHTAIRCLGELGPADLRTIVLEPEKRAFDYKCTPFELLTGHVLSLLAQYIVDGNIKVVKEASVALYEVLKFKEGKKIVDSSYDFGYGPINKDFLVPYTSNWDKPSQIRIDVQVLKTSINSDVWCPKKVVASNEWITSVVLALLDSFDDGCYLKSLVPVCRVKAKFSENLLPLLIYLMLSNNNGIVIQILAAHFNEFFNQHWNLTVLSSAATDQNLIPINKKAVKCMLDVINFIRQQPSVSKKLASLKLNYLAIAKAAAFCSAHFSALLYAELWCQEQMDDFEKQKTKNKIAFENGHSVLDFIYESVDKEVAIPLQQILQTAYNSIGDLDALSGCGMPLLLRPERRVEYYKNIGHWDYVMNYYTMHPIENSESSRQNLIESFKMNQLYQLPLLFDSLSKEPEYECLWRMGQWNLFKRDSNKTCQRSSDQYSKYQFASLKALCENDHYTFETSKTELSNCVINNLKHTSLESSKNIYPISSQLQSLVELEDSFKAIKSGNFEDVLAKWQNQDVIIRKNDFQFVEPIAAQRMTILGEYVKREPRFLKQYFDLVLDFADYAKEELHIRVAENAIINIRKLPNLDRTIEHELQFREAQLAWLNKDKMIAQQLLRNLSKDESITPRLKAGCLKLQGIYMAEMYSDRTSILNSFNSSIQIYKRIQNSLTPEDIKNLEDTYDKIATFADREYQQIMSYIKSDLFQKKLSNIKSCKEMAQALNDQKRKKSDDERKAQIIHQKQIRIDENEVNITLKDKDLVLLQAVKYYIKNLSTSDLNNIKIFRVMALFLDNRDNKNLLDYLKSMVQGIPTYKYITMLPQLIPHISTSFHDIFGQQINQIIEKCAVDHPHHTLPLLLALVNANKDREYTNPKAKISQNERSTIALSLIKKLKNRNGLNVLIDKMLRVAEALIELAYFVDTSHSGNSRKTEFNIPSKLKIHKIKDYSDILVPTISLPVSKTNDYNHIIGISKFSNKYKTVGGINAPKRIECLCTNGKSHYQLVKGQDDLRQDAVMQQVFTIMTDLLSTNKQTKDLLIRTYKIVPLSMRSGILEWVANSMPIGDYLTGSKDIEYMGAHREFRPQDKTPNECRTKFKNCSDKSVETKLEVFNSICSEFKPVFHKFFETHFRQPSVWYERKRAYIHSVATTSMCGYILGIGDRHVSNILIDKQTAEVIHIDFGIAFEQGKVLPTPETVPFRLTRDIVDGMGVSGTEGLFRKSCEKTMEVLRSNSQTILTILEVLLYDPLYFWTVSAAEANKRQTEEDYYNKETEESEDENKNVSAQRALLRLRGKLQGTEEGKPTSVEQQVGTLIQQAMDPANLCRLFNGWQPYI